MSDYLKPYSDQAISMALELGADSCDVIAQRGSSFFVSAQKGKVDKYKVSSANLIGIRVIKDHKVGLSYSEALETESITSMVKEALNVSAFASPDEHQAIVGPEHNYIETKSHLVQEDKSSTKDKIALALDLEAKVLESDKVNSSPYNGYSSSEGEVYYANHLGASCYQKDRTHSCYTSALASSGDKQAMYGHSMIGRTFGELSAQECSDVATRHALALLEGKALPTGRYDLIFEPDELAQIFGSFLSIFSAKAAMEGKNKFKDQLSQQVMDKRLSIYDRPTFRDGFAYSAFDDEGYLRQDLALVRSGQLESFYHNTITASYFGMKTTAHGARSPKGELGISGTQICIDPGLDEGIDKKRYIRVDSLKGLHSGTNPISGQFSLAIEGALVEDGQILQSVKDVTISGNFFELLKQVESVGSKVLANSMRSFFAPQIRFSNVSVAGS